MCPMGFQRTICLALVSLSTLLAGPSCKDAPPPPADPEVASFLMPPGKARVTLQVERLISLTQREPVKQARKVVVERSREGAVYRVRDPRDRVEWRSAGQLFFAARPDGAYLVRQFDGMGQAVGVRGRRLVFPWPASAGDRRKVSYSIHGRPGKGGGKARGTVTVLREGFSETVEGKAYDPCLEVQEVLDLPGGKRLDLRSVFCRGIGRVRIQQRSPIPSGGESSIIDQVVRLQDEAQ